MEGGSHALWRPCPHSTGFSSRQSTDWFRGLGWKYFFGVGNLLLEWGFSFWCGQLSLPHLEWGLCLWCGKFALWSGASLFDVGNSIRSGALTIGVGNCDRSGASSSGVGKLGWSPSAVLRETRTRDRERSHACTYRQTIFAEFLEWGVFFR